jgi:hypothetical protein
LAPSLPTFSPSTQAFFHMCLGRRSSWRRTMSPAWTCLTFYLAEWLHGSFLTLGQCFSTTGPWPGTGPWHQLYRAMRICHFSFLSIFHE